MNYIRLFSTLILLIAFSASPAFADADSDAVQQNLMCQCGCSMVLISCECGTAEQLRGEIRTMLGEGKSQQQILDYYVGKYGEKVLSAPTKQGFNLTAYITPFVAILVAGGAIYFVLRQWVFRSKPKPDETLIVPLVGNDTYEDLRAQLARELGSYDG